MKYPLSESPLKNLILTSRFCVLLTLATVFVGCKPKEAGPPPQMPPAAVTVTPALSTDVPVYIDEIGTIASPDNVSVRSQVGGKLISAHFVEGAEVKKGDLLFKIDPRPFVAVVAQAEADLLQAKVSLDLSRTEYDRAISVTDLRVLSQEQVDQRKNAVAVAEAQVQARQASVDTAKLNLEYCTITSPVSGRTGKRLVDPGNIVNENDQTLVVVQSLDPIYADFTVNENDLGTVRKYIATRGLDRRNLEEGLTCLVDVPCNSRKVLEALGTPVPATQPGKNSSGPREGKLVFLDNTVQAGTGTVQLRATLSNTDRYFWPGQFVNVRLVLATKKDAILIPAQAQQIGQQGPYVYVVSKEQKAQLRPIVTGQRQGSLLVVQSGIEAGEQIVVTGQMSLAPDAPVVVIPAEGAPAAPGTATAPAATAQADAPAAAEAATGKATETVR
jgi:multidrug efflux system membrane fusion protein